MKIYSVEERWPTKKDASRDGKIWVWRENEGSRFFVPSWELVSLDIYTAPEDETETRRYRPRVKSIFTGRILRGNVKEYQTPTARACQGKALRLACPIWAAYKHIIDPRNPKDHD